MIEVKKYHLPPTDLMPNSPYPLIHYPGLLDHLQITHDRPEKIHDLFQNNGWRTQWIFRYGPTQASHYHSAVHEVMAVLTGTATIRFGVADTFPELDKDDDHEHGGVELAAKAGDVFVLPAGTAHKTYKTTPGEFALLTPGSGHGVEAEDVRGALADLKLSGYTMMGAYPVGGGTWDFAVGGEKVGDEFKEVWAVPKPSKDPVLGTAEDGICGTWN